jgi:hypothetical protein
MRISPIGDPGGWQDRVVGVLPFERLSPARGVDHARWFVETMAGREGMALVVPAGFEAYARLLHPLAGGQRWATAAPDYTERGVDRYRYPFPQALAAVEGDMGPDLVDALVPVLSAATATPQQCHFGLWRGWGELHAGAHRTLYLVGGGGRWPLAALRWRGDVRRLERRQQHAEEPVGGFVAACAVQPWWGGRDMLLFDGPIERVIAIGTPDPFESALRRRGPQWWWPADRSWFVATEIDYPWTYVAGTRALVDDVTTHADVEALRVEHTDRW